MGQVLSSVVNWFVGAYLKRNSKPISSPRLSDPLNLVNPSTEFNATEEANHVINVDDITEFNSTEEANHVINIDDINDSSVTSPVEDGSSELLNPVSTDADDDAEVERVFTGSDDFVSICLYWAAKSNSPDVVDHPHEDLQRSYSSDIADSTALLEDEVTTNVFEDYTALSLPDEAGGEEPHSYYYWSRSTSSEDLEEVKQVISISNVDFISLPREEDDSADDQVRKKRPDLLFKPERWIKYYCSSHKILLVGEGDFSFSACLAKAFCSADNMIATSLNSEEFLQRNYGHAMSNIAELRIGGGRVIHNVDATKMASYDYLNFIEYDRIVYNFPLAGFFRDESRKDQLRRNQDLVRLFLKNAKQMISKTGEIHITHKSNGFFLQWDLHDLAWKNGLKLIEEARFNLRDYPGYFTKYGFGGDKNFNCHPSKTYKFQLQ